MQISNIFVCHHTKIKNALKAINESGFGLCLLVDQDHKFMRTVTDGDLRRLIVEDHGLDEDLSCLTPIQSIWGDTDTGPSALLSLMRENDISHIPIINNEGIPIEIVLRKNLEAPILLSYPHMGCDEIDFINEAFESNWIAPLGPNVERFEEEMAEKVDVKAALAVSSGTAALHLALDVLNVREGDIVFCSSFTFIASANPILYLGATPVFIDSELETWNMSAQALKRAFEYFEKRGVLPKAVIIANLYGQNANMDSLKAICDVYNVPIVEDAAESLGATYKGKHSGTLGTIGIYSFNGNKIITTSGGGMLVSNNSELIEQARFLSTQAKDPAKFYLHSRVGYNYRMSNILAGVGRGQLRVLNERVHARRTIFERYKKELENIQSLQWMPEPEGYYSTRWLTCCLNDQKLNSKDTSTLSDAFARRGIEVRRTWKPMHQQPLFEGCLYFPHDETFSVSDYLFENGLCLPSSSNMSISDQLRTIKEIKNIIQ